MRERETDRQTEHRPFTKLSLYVSKINEMKEKERP